MKIYITKGELLSLTSLVSLMDVGDEEVFREMIFIARHSISDVEFADGFGLRLSIAKHWREGKATPSEPGRQCIKKFVIDLLHKKAGKAC